MKLRASLLSGSQRCSIKQQCKHEAESFLDRQV